MGTIHRRRLSLAIVGVPGFALSASWGSKILTTAYYLLLTAYYLLLTTYYLLLTTYYLLLIKALTSEPLEMVMAILECLISVFSQY